VKLTLAIAAAALLLAGCGRADPFVGTWQAQSKGGPSFVISKQDPHYLAVASSSGDIYYGSGVLDRHDGALTVSIRLPAQIETIRMTVGPHGCLQAVDDGVAGEEGPGPVLWPNERATLVKVSDSTAAPTPSP